MISFATPRARKRFGQTSCTYRTRRYQSHLRAVSPAKASAWSKIGPGPGAITERPCYPSGAQFDVVEAGP